MRRYATWGLSNSLNSRFVPFATPSNPPAQRAKRHARRKTTKRRAYPVLRVGLVGWLWWLSLSRVTCKLRSEAFSAPCMRRAAVSELGGGAGHCSATRPAQRGHQPDLAHRAPHHVAGGAPGRPTAEHRNAAHARARHRRVSRAGRAGSTSPGLPPVLARLAQRWWPGLGAGSSLARLPSSQSPTGARARRRTRPEHGVDASDGLDCHPRKLGSLNDTYPC